MIPHCAVCANWQRVRPPTYGNCPVQVARKTKGPFRWVVVLMNWQQWCDAWKAKEERGDV